MPEDKSRLRSVELIDPDKRSYVLYDDGGAHSAYGITAIEDRSYIMLRVPYPRQGEWVLSIVSKGTREMAINTVIRFNHNLRLRVEIPQEVYVDASQQVNVWLQQYKNGEYVDLIGSDIYKYTTASLKLYTPGQSGKSQTGKLPLGGNGYKASMKFKKMGTWRAEVTAQNEYFTLHMDNIAFEVVPAPTPVPTPVSTVTPRINDAVNGSFDQSRQTDGSAAGLEGNANDAAQDGNIAEEIGVNREKTGGKSSDGIAGINADSSEAEGSDNGTAGNDGKGADQSGDKAQVSGSAMETEARDQADEKTIHEEGGDFNWKVSADSNNKELKISWEGDDMEDATAELRADGDDGSSSKYLASGDSIKLGELDENQSYTLILTAFSDPDAEEGEKPPMHALKIERIPDAEEIAEDILALTDTFIKLSPLLEATKDALLNGTLSSDEAVDSTDALEAGEGHAEANAVEETAGEQANSTGGDGQRVESKARSTKKPSATVSPETAQKTVQGDSTKASTVQSTEIAEGITMEDAEVTSPKNADSSALDFLKRYWFFVLIGVVVLATVIAVIIILNRQKVEKVTGFFKVECEALNLNINIRFEGTGRIPVGAPLTSHPSVAKLKGTKTYDVLSHLRISTAQADNNGLAPGSDVQHSPNDKLVRIAFTDSKTREERVCYVGGYDLAPSTMLVSDMGRSFELTFSGNLSFDELMRQRR